MEPFMISSGVGLMYENNYNNILQVMLNVPQVKGWESKYGFG